MQKHLASIALAFLCLLPAATFADVRLPAIISNNMVLQANKPLPIWGWAAAGEKVTVTLGEQSVSTVADGTGNWKLSLKPVKLAAPGDKPLEMTVEGANKITIKNILIGTVWICSGQSNMSFALKQAHNNATEIPKAKYPNIRLFTVPRLTSVTPMTDVKGVWVECTPETATSFSAVGYFFGRDVHEGTGQPTGLIHTSWGGTTAQAWTSLEALRKDKELAEYVAPAQKAAKEYPAAAEKFAKDSEAYPAARKEWETAVGPEYLAAVKTWESESRKAKAAKKPEPTKPTLPSGAKAEPKEPASPLPGSNHPTSLYNAMIAPLIPYAIEGAIWYQGESNAGKAPQYATLFPRMINDWRERWGEGDFPFYFVQLANYQARKPEPGDSNWAELRESQTKTLALPNTGMAVIIDLGDAGNIHPTNKIDVGRRLALWALHDTFGKPVVRSGPLFSSMKVEGNKIRVSFKEIGGGLIIKNAAATATQPATLKGFAIAGADGKFEWANAVIDGESVVVSSDKVAAPTAVRYAWADNPECNLYNKEGLPASPFRAAVKK